MMGGVKTYDQVAWHYPEGRGCPSLDAAKVHFDVIMRWLGSRDLLSAEGREAMEGGIDSDFALTSHMVTDKGNRVLASCYADWLRTLRYGSRPSVKLLDECFKEIERNE